MVSEKTKVCSKCGEPGEFAKGQAWCKVCRRRYYVENRERILAQKREFYAQHRVVFRAKARRYYEAHREIKNLRSKEYFAMHREEMNAQRRQWTKDHIALSVTRKREYHAAHKAKDNSNSQRWRANNPGRCKTYTCARRARKAGSGGHYTVAEWSKVFRFFDARCACCRRSGLVIQRDHIQPLSVGGTSWITNMQPLCEACNLGRSKTLTFDCVAVRIGHGLDSETDLRGIMVAAGAQARQAKNADNCRRTVMQKHKVFSTSSLQEIRG